MNLIVLEEVLNHIHNWFVRDSFVVTNATISDGELPDEIASRIPDGAFFRIQGSFTNDGLYVKESYSGTALSDQFSPFDNNELSDEEVARMVVSVLAIPRPLLLIEAEIEDWEAKYGEVAKGPFFSEEFGGYKYEIRGYSSYGAASSTYSGWRLAFANRLNPYRKMY